MFQECLRVEVVAGMVGLEDDSFEGRGLGRTDDRDAVRRGGSGAKSEVCRSVRWDTVRPEIPGRRNFSIIEDPYNPIKYPSSSRLAFFSNIHYNSIDYLQRKAVTAYGRNEPESPGALSR